MAHRECPRCWKPLEAETRDAVGPDVTVDVCPECDGLYLDEGEILRITGDIDLHRLLTDYLGADADGELVCPSCGGIMDAEYLEVEDGEAEVEVDVCLDCHGIWCDAGELEAVASSSADFGDLDDEKRAELHDAGTGGGRGLIRSLLGSLRR
jgi:Zn-finger nucleic acid-binding protein